MRNNLKSCRKELCLTQRQAADSINIGLRLYQYYEADKKEPGVRTAIRIAKVLNTTVESLYGD